MVKSEKKPDISFIVPCYNEEDLIGYTLPRLINSFKSNGYELELVAVDNGSTDRTAEIIQGLMQEHDEIVFSQIDVNRGYGNGVISSIKYCTAPWVGIIPADGQVDAEDVVRLYEAIVTTNGIVLGKVRRRFRMDGLYRKVVSTVYNIFVRMLWPMLASIDINGSPKILPRDYILRMNLQSKGWLLDPEIMIKGHKMGLKVIELNVFARMRGNGVSHVRVETCWEFFRNLLSFRFSRKWKKEFENTARAEMPTGKPGTQIQSAGGYHKTG